MLFHDESSTKHANGAGKTKLTRLLRHHLNRNSLASRSSALFWKPASKEGGRRLWKADSPSRGRYYQGRRPKVSGVEPQVEIEWMIGWCLRCWVCTQLPN